MRIEIDLPPAQITSLAKLAKSWNMSRAQLIRRAIAKYLEDNKAKPVNAFGLWKGREIDALKWQEQMRSEQVRKIHTSGKI